jgi:hypothetical protein
MGSGNNLASTTTEAMGVFSLWKWIRIGAEGRLSGGSLEGGRESAALGT